MKVKEIMTEAPATCSPDTTLDKIAKLMIERNCGEIPVSEGPQLVGVITDRDIACRGFTGERNPLDITAREIMTKDVITVSERDDVDVALKLMQDRQVRRLPVVHDGNIIGIVSVADLVPSLPHTKVARLVTEVSRPTIEVAVPAP
jgi:CBS domain-containing protein